MALFGQRKGCLAKSICFWVIPAQIAGHLQSIRRAVSRATLAEFWRKRDARRIDQAGSEFGASDSLPVLRLLRPTGVSDLGSGVRSSEKSERTRSQSGSLWTLREVEMGRHYDGERVKGSRSYHFPEVIHVRTQLVSAVLANCSHWDYCFQSRRYRFDLKRECPDESREVVKIMMRHIV